MNDMIRYSRWDAELCIKMYDHFRYTYNTPEGKSIMKIGRLRVSYVEYWRSRAYPYWFNTKYPDGHRRICVPFLTIDIRVKEPKKKHKK